MLVTHYVNNETGKVELDHNSTHDSATEPPKQEGYSVISTHDDTTICDYCREHINSLLKRLGVVAPEVISTKTPTYYTGTGQTDVIGFMTPQVEAAQMEGFFRMNIMKYLTRYDKKGTPIDDLNKAYDYLGKLIEHVKQNSPQ